MRMDDDEDKPDYNHRQSKSLIFSTLNADVDVSSYAIVPPIQYFQKPIYFKVVVLLSTLNIVNTCFSLCVLPNSTI